MAALQIQEDNRLGVPDVVVTSKDVSPKDEPVLVRGNLQKLGKRFKGWHQRYFEIQGSHMYYYKNTTKKDCLGEINLLICFYCEPTTAATFGSPFELRTVQRSHILAARSKQEMQQWIQVIKQQMSSSEKEAKKGTSKKAAKPKRWESFKNTFTLNTRSRSQSPAVETRDPKKTAKKSFMDRFKVKREPPQPADHPTSKRPLSLTGADEKHKDTLDVFAQFEVSKSLPSSPVLKKKKASVASLETATPVSPMSMTSGSPFTPGGVTTDSQTSTPVHTDTEATKQNTHTSNAQGGVESGPTAIRQEVQVRVDIEDTSAPTPVIPVIVEPGAEVLEIPADAGEPAEPAKPDDVVVESVESPAEQAVAEEKEGDVAEVPGKLLEAAEPTAAEDKEVESSTNRAELDESVEPTDVESSIKPNELVALDKEAETTKGPTKPIEPAEPPIENDAKEIEIDTIEKEPEVEEIMAAAEPGISDEAAEEVSMIEEENKPIAETMGHVAEIQGGVADRMPSEEPAMPVESAAVIGKDAKKKIDKKPALPAKPAVVTDTETKRMDEQLTKPAKPAAGSEEVVEKTEEPFLPKYLKDRHFQWDKIREILATAPESTESGSYSELPPQDVSWMDHSSPAEQLRAFLLLCP